MRKIDYTKYNIKKMVTTKNGKNKVRLCILTTKHYNSSLEYFLYLFEVAKKDFPQLLSGDIEVKTYGGRFRKGLCGIEFKVKQDIIPDGYEEVSDHVVYTIYPTI